jgi:hypothetical protein
MTEIASNGLAGRQGISTEAFLRDDLPVMRVLDVAHIGVV